MPPIAFDWFPTKPRKSSNCNKVLHRRQSFTRGAERAYFRSLTPAAWQRAHEAWMSPLKRRAESIRAEIDSLKYKSFQINVEPTRQRLERELAALALA